MITKKSGIALHDLALAATSAWNQVTDEFSNLLPPNRAWPGAGALWAFNFSQILQPAGQFFGNSACWTKTTGKSGDQI